MILIFYVIILNEFLYYSKKCSIVNNLFSYFFLYLVETKTNEVENDQNSILSADDSSSGYESFKAMKDIDK